MGRYFGLLAGLGLILFLTQKVQAKIPPPLLPVPEEAGLPLKKNLVTLKIMVDAKAKESWVSVPLPPPQVEVPRPRGELKKNENPFPNNQISTGYHYPNYQRLVVGLVFSLCFSLGGLWLVRKKNPGSRTGLFLLLTLGGLLSVGVGVWGNAPAPIDLFFLPPQNQDPPIAWEGKALVTFNPGGEVRLILDKESFEKFKKGNLQAVAIP